MRRNVKHIIGFDCEGDAGNKGFISAAFVSDDEQVFLTSQDETIEYILSFQSESTIFVATNLEYDLAVIFQNNLHHLKLFYANNRLLYGKLANDDAKIEFWDTLRCIGLYSVATLGKMVGLTKLKTPPYLTGEEDEDEPWYCEKHGTKYCLECYNINDSLISRSAFLLFSTGIKAEQGSLQKTIASTSISVWKSTIPKGLRVGLPRNMDIPCREGYYGGRTEAFQYGTVKNINKYDVNSLYPFAMYNFPFPDVSTLYADSGKQPIEKYINTYGVVNADVEVPTTHIPPLPFRYKGKLVFPTGSFTGTYVIQELLNAMRYGVKVTNVNWAVYTHSKCFPFRDYVETMYAKRQAYKKEGNPLENVYKILMNSLYGKLGQRLDGDIGWLMILSEETEKYLVEGTNIITFANEAWFKFGVDRHYSPFYLNVLWAAYVTAYGRMTLYEYFDKCDFNVAYCDTDSVFTPLSLPTSSDLGDIKLEDSNVKCTFLGPKFYAIHHSDGSTHYALKGAPPKLMADYFAGKEITMNIPVKIKSGIKQGLTPGSWRNLKRQFSYEFDKRVLDARDTKGLTGNCTTSPLSLVNGKPDSEIDVRTDLIFDFERDAKSFIRSIGANS